MILSAHLGYNESWIDSWSQDMWEVYARTSGYWWVAPIPDYEFEDWEN